MAQFGKTGWAAATYVLLAAVQRGLSLLILPFVTHAMPPAEYGAASMLTAAALFLSVIVAQPLIQLIIRAAARDDEDGPALLRIAGTYCYVIVPAAAALVAAVFFFFVPQLLGVAGQIWGIEVFAVGFQPAASVFALWVAQAREDIRRFVWLSVSSIIMTAASKLLLIVVFDMGVLGWVISDLLSAVVAALLAMVLVRVPRASVRSHHVRYAFYFSLPLVPHSVSLWALMFLSRPVMATVSPLAEVGLLSFGLNLAQVAGLVLAETNRAALPRFARETLPAPTRETFGPVRWQLVAAFVVPAVIGAAVAVVGHVIFAESYWASFALTGILLIGQAAYGLYLIPMNYLTQTAGLPKYSALASGAGAAAILVLILILGRTHGPMGVAYATTIAYVAMAVVALILTFAQKLEIAWTSWIKSSPEVALAAIALTFSVASLMLPVGSTGPLVAAGSGVAFVLAAVVCTARRNPRSEPDRGRHRAS